MANIYEKLLNIQNELKAPKNQFNKFGNYSYRNCEDILEAVKPLCKENKAVLFISDKIINIESRFYVEATATLVNIEDPSEKIIATASARESETKKGMDDSQVTGATSSYARKYALNGLFDIDDTKDADTDAFNEQTTPKKGTKQTPRKNETKQPTPPPITASTLRQIEILANEFAKLKERKLEEVYQAMQEKFNYPDIKKLTEADGQTLINTLINWTRQAKVEEQTKA